MHHLFHKVICELQQVWWLFSCFIIHLTLCRIQFNTLFPLAFHKTWYSHPKSHIITTNLYVQKISFEHFGSLIRVRYLLCSSNMSSSQPEWLGQHKPVWQLLSSNELLCSPCAASPMKGSRCVYRAPCKNEASCSQVDTCLPPLLIDVQQGRSRISPTATGQSIIETGLQTHFNNSSSALESHRNSAREFLGAVASCRGDQRRQRHNMPPTVTVFLQR